MNDFGDLPRASRPCADFSMVELLCDPAFYKVVLVFLAAAVFTLVMYWPARLWAWRRAYGRGGCAAKTGTRATL